MTGPNKKPRGGGPEVQDNDIHEVTQTPPNSSTQRSIDRQQAIGVALDLLTHCGPGTATAACTRARCALRVFEFAPTTGGDSTADPVVRILLNAIADLRNHQIISARKPKGFSHGGWRPSGGGLPMGRAA